jgi:hypothetical protein
MRREALHVWGGEVTEGDVERLSISVSFDVGELVPLGRGASRPSGS